MNPARLSRFWLIHVLCILLTCWTCKTQAQVTQDNKPGSSLLKSESGKLCIGECREGGAHEKHWCYVPHNWDYCTPNSNPFYNIVSYSVNGIITTRGIACRTPCAKDGKSYSWCKTIDKYSIGQEVHNWDYCSLTPGTDVYGNKCKDACSYKGENYKWCNLQGSSWGYCS